MRFPFAFLRDDECYRDVTTAILGGYIFDKRAQYSFTIRTSAGAASIVVAGNIGWRFSKAFTLTGGYTGVPGSRSLVATFPFFTSTDRSMADNFFRPGFTQGAWGSGEPVKGLNYLVFVGRVFCKLGRHLAHRRSSSKALNGLTGLRRIPRVFLEWRVPPRFRN
jgi:hypothetical protein